MKGYMQGSNIMPCETTKSMTFPPSIPISYVTVMVWTLSNKNAVVLHPTEFVALEQLACVAPAGNGDFSL